MKPHDVLDWVDFLRSNGCSNIVDFGDWVMCNCIFHNQSDSTRPSMGIYKEDGFVNCFGCGRKSWEDLCNVFGIASEDFIDAIRSKQWEAIRRKIFGKNEKKKFKRYKLPSCTYGISASVKYFQDRGISSGVVNFYDIGLCQDINSKYNNYLVFPVYDDKGVLFFNARYIGTEKWPPRWRMPKDAAKWKTYFNWNNVFKNHLRKTLFFVEGYSDVMKMVQLGIPNTIAAKDFSPYQINMILNSKVENIFTLYDSDEGGQFYNQKSYNLLSNSGRLIYNLKLPDYAKDPAEVKKLDDVFDINPILTKFTDTFFLNDV